MLATADTDSKAGIFSTAFLPITLMNILVVTSHAVNGFITSVIAPSIVVDLGGRELMFWLFALFQVGSISAGVIAGNFKVRFGARPIFMTAAALLAFGSIMGGLATNLAWVIVARGLQGIAEGMLISLVYVVIADHLPARLLPRIFALSSTLWSIAAATTPLFAGLLTQYVSWRVAFLFNLPLVLILIALAFKFLPATVPSDEAPKPFPLRRLLLLVAALLITGFAGQIEQIGFLALIIAASSTLLVVFATLDQKAVERFMPPNLFSLRTNLGRCFTMLGLFSIGASGRVVYIVALLQAIWLLSPLAAGYAASSIAFSWTLAAWMSNRIEKMENRLISIRLGASLIMAGGFLSAYAVWSAQFWLLLASLITTGLGYGASSPLIRQIIITQAPKEHRSIASGAMTPIQFTGAVFGAAIAGFCALAFGLFEGAVAGSIFTVDAARNAGAGLLLVFAAFATLGMLVSFGLTSTPDHDEVEQKSEALA
ncbi:MFS transporter [Maritalea mediterranea]|uniref:MFS transporter n=1 Tax=Maritalea mediterranea TaxID=2909667 RepID=A0ABS9EB51_9HYPH|nr:MFS transporter [Maritalea mediterranea]MCF4098985.1 MFS transporter [Maritalea mediterranea]